MKFLSGGRTTTASLLNRHGPIEAFPPDVLGAERERALLFKRLAILKTDAELFADVDELEWTGHTAKSPDWADRIADPRLLTRCSEATKARRVGLPPLL